MNKDSSCLQENDSFPVASVENHREREKGVLVYPVSSRRSGGLSLGINLFPDRKRCSFDCPYCEVFPFSTNAVFSIEQMETDLCHAVATAVEYNIVVKDICFSGNGEPLLSPDFPAALSLAARVRNEMAAGAELVLITNGAGLLDEKLFSLLHEAAHSLALNIWLKLDAGTPEWYKKINCSDVPFDTLLAAIKQFAAVAPVTIQTMLCAVDGEGPPPEETSAWEQIMLELAATAAGQIGNAAGSSAGSPAGGIRKVQIYGKARPSPDDPKTTPLPVAYLEERAASLREKFNSAFPQVEVFP